jgi:pimeloyl-ACP methyl ester carboxylesterase
MTTIDDRPRKARLFAAPLQVRAAFGVLERLAPAVGARWAERIWFTLPGRPPLGPATGRGFHLNVDGCQLTGATWGCGPAVYLMHGWAGNSGQLAAFVAPLTARGYRVIAFDTPSHGTSGPGAFGPRSSSLPEFVRALTAVATIHGPAHAVIAHSMGATAAATALTGGTLHAERLVLLAPMAAPALYARQFTTALGGGARTYQRLLTRAERRIGAPMRDFDIPELGLTATTLPTLIVHDREDAFMPVAHSTAIAAVWTSATLHLTSGLGHRRLLRDPEVIARVVQFVSG